MTDQTTARQDRAGHPTILRVLDLSTRHLPEHLAQTGLNAFDGVIADELAYGWLLWVPENPDQHAADYDDPIPPEVLAIQRYARSYRCDWVQLDRVATAVAALPSFDW